MEPIYLDYAAMTPLDPEVKAAMDAYLRKPYGNPSSLHALGLEARRARDEAHAAIAKLLHIPSSGVIMTASGTESVNLALQGFAHANKSRGNHIITSQIEHHAVLNSCKALEKEGFKVTYMKPSKEGLINPQDISSAFTNETILVSIMYVNNEIGTIQPIKEIGKICKEKNIAFHTDACQAPNYLPMNMEDLNVDMLSFSGSKIYGPSGTGALCIKPYIKLQPILYGGGQEHGLRSGTENVAGMIGLAKAFEITAAKCDEEYFRLSALRDWLIMELEELPGAMLNGSRSDRVPNNISMSFKNQEAMKLLFALSEKGIYVSTGAACTTGKAEPSHVIRALGYQDRASSTLRITLGRGTAKERCLKLIEELKKIVAQNLRSSL